MIDVIGNELLMYIALRDPEGVARLALEEKGYARNRLTDAMEAWGKKDPDAALEWYRERLDDGSFVPKGAMDLDEARDAFGLLISGIAQTDLSRAIDLLQTSEAATVDGALYRIAFELGEPHERTTVTEMLRRKADASLVNKMENFYARASIENESPAAAWNYLSKGEMPESERRKIMSDALVFEADRNYPAAARLLTWIGENADWFSNGKAVRQMVSKWSLTDRQAADRWAEQHSELMDSPNN